MTCSRWSSLCLLLLLSLVSCDKSRSRPVALPESPIDTPVSVELSFPSNDQSGVVSIELTLSDDADTTVDVTLEFTLDGSSYQAVTLLDTSAVPLGLQVNATAQTLEFLWDSVIDQVAIDNVEESVRLRITITDETGSQSFESDPFLLDNFVDFTEKLSDISPDFGPGATEVTLSGYNLGYDVADIRVFFGEHAAEVVSLFTDDLPTPEGFLSELVVIAPPEVATAAVRLEIEQGISVDGPVFHGAARVDSATLDSETDLLVIAGAQLLEDNVVVDFTSAGQTTSVFPITVTESRLEVQLPLFDDNDDTPIELIVRHRGGLSNAIEITLPANSDVPARPAITALTVPSRALAGSIAIHLHLLQEINTSAVDLEFEFATDAGFAPATIIGEDHLQVTASPFVSNRVLRFLWNAADDLDAALHTRVVLRVTPRLLEDDSAGARFTSAPFWVDVNDRGVTVVEEFNDNNNELATETSADWNGRLLTAAGEQGALVALDRLQSAPWGSGVDGAFHATTSLTLLTDGSDPVFGGQDGVFEFTSFIIDAGVTVRASGSHPLILKVVGLVSIQGTLDLSGAAGAPGTAFSSGSGGLGNCAGGAGGAGGALRSGVLTDGESAHGGGQGGATQRNPLADSGGGGGGGGGFQNPGTAGAMQLARGGRGGVPRGLDAMTTHHAGSGGGGGGAHLDTNGRFAGGGGGGGAGGGHVQIHTDGTVTLSGAILAHGGHGGNGFNTGSGGGGSGGLIAIHTTRTIVFEDGCELGAQGGSGGNVAPIGGRGSDGRIFLNTPFPTILPTNQLTLAAEAFVPAPGQAGFVVASGQNRNFGNGSDGDFVPTSDVTLVTDGVDPNFGGLDGVFNFANIDIPAGVVVRATGTRALTLRATGHVTIAGRLDISGSDAIAPTVIPPTAGQGGDGGPGGGDGGRGGFFNFQLNVAFAGEAGQLPTQLSPGQGNPVGLGAATLIANEASPPRPQVAVEEQVTPSQERLATMVQSPLVLLAATPASPVAATISAARSMAASCCKEVLEEEEEEATLMTLASLATALQERVVEEVEESA